MKEEFDYQEDLKIDKFALDAELLDQPRRFAKWATSLANAEQEKDDAKSRVDLAIRTDPKAYGLDKVTESGVKAALDSDAEVIAARHKVDVLTVAKDAFIQRKYMLEKLVELYLSGYYAQPKVPKQGELSEESTSSQKSVLNQRLKR